MLITLKQHEIVAALRLYVATNGINLSGKSLDVAFTAGRKESGLTAEVSIEDDGSKALDAVQLAPVAPALTGPVTLAAAIATETPSEVVADATPDTGAPVVSLFG